MRLLFVLPLLFLTSCQTLHFYTQGVRGQVEILQKSRPNAEVIASPTTSEAVKERLKLAEELCEFASNELALQVKMSDKFALSVGFGVRHNTDPPAGLEKTDTLTTVNLVYAL